MLIFLCLIWKHFSRPMTGCYGQRERPWMQSQSRSTHASWHCCCGNHRSQSSVVSKRESLRIRSDKGPVVLGSLSRSVANVINKKFNYFLTNFTTSSHKMQKNRCTFIRDSVFLQWKKYRFCRGLNSDRRIQSPEC